MPRTAQPNTRWRWPKRLAIIAGALLLAGGMTLGIAILCFDLAERHERSRPSNYAEVSGTGVVELQGPSSWTVRYRGPNARQVAREMFQTLIIHPTVSLRVESNIEDERSSIEPPSGSNAHSDDRADLAWLHLGRGMHRVSVHNKATPVATSTPTVTFERWRRQPVLWPLAIIALLTLPCLLASLVMATVAGIWALWLGWLAPKT